MDEQEEEPGRLKKKIRNPIWLSWYLYTHLIRTSSAKPVITSPKRRPAIFGHIYHSYKRRKLSATVLQEMVDHINLDLDDFDIDDHERTLPFYIFDLGM